MTTKSITSVRPRGTLYTARRTSGSIADRYNKAILGPNSLPGFWTQRISLMIPIHAGFGTNQRGPKSGQGKLADLDALV